ncbi:uncharacterized protein LOC135101360 isoform X1 [Scylla paramamosain]|uniref:uncharacterized protein LOC135101360 isoform X1 n=1 Tax=Scylla paramamosain TaxID=85552 RepID=UPI0030828F03
MWQGNQDNVAFRNNQSNLPELRDSTTRKFMTSCLLVTVVFTTSMILLVLDTGSATADTRVDQECFQHSAHHSQFGRNWTGRFSQHASPSGICSLRYCMTTSWTIS